MVLILATAASCGPRPEDAGTPGGALGTLEAELSQVPPGVACVVLALSGSVSTSLSFTVAAGTAPVQLSVGPLPSGNVTVTARAYALACGAVTSASPATWTSVAVSSVVTPGLTTRLAVTLRQNLPVSVDLDFQATVVKFSLGWDSTYAILSDGTVRAWGDNYYRQLGTGDTSRSSSRPTVVPGLSGATAISGGYSHACALDGSGRAFCWGRNLEGQLGNGTMADSATPVPVAGGLTFSELSASMGDHLCGRTATGYACWGRNAEGQLGTCSTAPTLAPVSAPCLPGGLLVAGFHTSLSFSGNASWAAGVNYLGQAGNGVATNPITTFTGSGYTAAGARFVTAASLGPYHGCVVEASLGEVYCAGLNQFGELGQPPYPPPSTPLPPTSAGLRDAVAVAAGLQHTCALKTDGSVWCWGLNTGGYLGDGSSTDRWWPAMVKGLGSVVALEAGQYHTCALKKDGTLWCWGSNAYGQLGDGTTVYRSLPIKVQL